MTRVAVCVCTFRRPRSLGRLLASLAGQRFEGEPPEVELIVVDNDADGSARPVVERWSERFGWPVRYTVEPERGIPMARNRALAEAAGDADVIAFVDDDDRPEPGWLDRLLAGLDRYDADVATGPQIPVYPAGIPDWIPRGGFFGGRRRPTGSEVDVAYTHNVAFRAELLDELESWFDETLRDAGGSDSDFFRRVQRLDRKFVWIDEAVVLEPVPDDRARGGWIVRRYYRYGTTAGFLQRRRNPSTVGMLFRTARAVGRGLLSPLRLAALPYEGRGAAMRMVADAAFAAGFLAGLAGFNYGGYVRLHGEHEPTSDGEGQG